MTRTVTPGAAAPLAVALGTDPHTAADWLRAVNDPRHDRWRHQVRRTGGCADPVRLSGATSITDRATGTVLHRYTTTGEPGGVLRVACGNRRASRCPTCARRYAGDTFHLVRAGLVGGKGVPESVRERPRLFVTLTAPSFGPVHNRPDTGRCCRCGTDHPDGDPSLGTPLDPDRYDYAGAVLFNSHAGELWHRFITYLRRLLARTAGVARSALGEVARLSFAKVAEFQRRGAVHLHAVIRLDGPDGDPDAVPPWATSETLTSAVRSAAGLVAVPVSASGPHPARVLRWGEQVDARPIAAFGSGEVTDAAVAGYVAKYATKAAESTGSTDRRIGERAELDRLHLAPHPRRLIETCWELAPHYPDRRLDRWSHMLGFRGHFSTKSRRYSTTLGALRAARSEFRARLEREALDLPPAGDDPDASTLTLAHWVYAGHGHSPGESLLAAQMAHEMDELRELARLEQTGVDERGGSPWIGC